MSNTIQKTYVNSEDIATTKPGNISTGAFSDLAGSKEINEDDLAFRSLFPSKCKLRGYTNRIGAVRT